jgi:hypothetical protein
VKGALIRAAKREAALKALGACEIRIENETQLSLDYQSRAHLVDRVRALKNNPAFVSGEKEP